MSAGINSRNASIYKDPSDGLYYTRIPPVQVIADIEAATISEIYNVDAANASQEYSQLLSDGTKKFLIGVRGSANLQLAFTSGESGTKFITIPCGASYKEESVNLKNVTLYFQTDQAAQTVEILEWR